VKTIISAILALAVALWPLLAPHLDCLWVALCIASLWMLIGLSVVESAALRRRAFIGFYLSTRGGLGRLLRPGLLLLAVQGFKSGLFALLLLVGALGLSPAQRWVLLADALLLVPLQALMHRLLQGHIRVDIQGPLTRHWAHWVNALLLWLALTAVGLIASDPNYRGMDWDQAVLSAAERVMAGCDVLAMLGRLQVVGTALPGWAAENLLSGNGAMQRSPMAWLLLAVSAGVSFLFAWSYSRLLSGVSARPLALLRPGKDTS